MTASKEALHPGARERAVRRRMHQLVAVRRQRLEEAELRRRALERWENEGGRPLPNA
jgi:hypothetical protein